MLDGGVLGDEVDDDPQAQGLRLVEQDRQVRDVTEPGIDREVVGDVVPAVVVRRRVERQQPQAVGAEPADVLQSLGDPAEVAPPVSVGVQEERDVDLVDNRVAVPQRLRRPSPPASRDSTCPGTHASV
jgi:hypothetical protein